MTVMEKVRGNTTKKDIRVAVLKFIPLLSSSMIF